MTENLELHQFQEGSHTVDESNRWLERLKTRVNCPYLGIILATLSSLFFSLCSVIVKGLVDVNPMELAAFRFVGVLLPTIPILIYTRQPVFPQGTRVILLMRCFMGTTGLMLSFYAFRHMPLADASVIIFSTPVFVAIFARAFLKEPCTMFNVITINITLVGVVLITRPPFVFGETTPPPDEQLTGRPYDIWGPVAAFSSTLFGANVYILLRALKNLHFSVIMTNFGATALVYTLIVCASIGAVCWPSCGRDRWLVLVLGVFSFLGQILLTLSLQIEQAGPVAIARCADIVFAFIWQMIFFGETPNGYSLFGALMVISSVILTALKKWAMTLPRESSLRKRLRLILLE
ncbi:solute carrier family 35 member G1 [Drosophila miranda]|uniref:Solute carrier family 35 member G1 n=1 Tax=Drosophila pseudoobscura pseudoobscura TaxID=46245 RepID=A0A6I8URA2_DROPS|nr:solute carrier family 35 member G1 [Drosophila pseudoobscura]XP_017141817.1 solute carrier family 35 member G1 [Drosophila miranda]XP_026848092.1 solute carrier family 35 member G1 [Drosophila persimilis]